jgi:hypothetical protein
MVAGSLENLELRDCSGYPIDLLLKIKKHRSSVFYSYLAVTEYGWLPAVSRGSVYRGTEAIYQIRDIGIHFILTEIFG